MLDENQQGIDIEAEANAFAANLLMPNNDFRAQAEGQKFSALGPSLPFRRQQGSDHALRVQCREYE
jgi:hypothetical protein